MDSLQLHFGATIATIPLYKDNPRWRWWKWWQPRYVPDLSALPAIFNRDDKLLDGMLVRVVETIDG